MPTKPTGLQLEKLSTALLDAFDHDDLTRFTRHQLDLSLEAVTPVAGKRDLTTIAMALVAHFAAQEGGLKRLLAAAQKENPTNAALTELMLAWFDAEFEPINLTELKEQLASDPTLVIGINLEDVEAATIELADIIAQGDGNTTGVSLDGVKVSGDIKISNVQAGSQRGT